MQTTRLGTSNLLPEGADLSRSFIKGNGFGAGGSVGLGEDAGTYGWAGAAGTVGFVNLRVVEITPIRLKSLEQMLGETVAYWREWVRTLSLPLDWQTAVIRAAIADRKSVV